MPKQNLQPIELTAKNFSEKLNSLKSSTELQKYEKFFDVKKYNLIGVRMGQIFALAKEYINMSLNEIEKLLESPIHEMKVGAVSIMDYQARSKKVTEPQKKELFDLYIRKHDRINTWDLVDRSAIYVVGSYLANKPRKILYSLAKSKNMAERRTAIVSTAYFMMKFKETEDTFKIAEILLHDEEDLIHKATGWMLRIAGDVDQKELLKFLDKYATSMPRVMLRYSIEKLDQLKKKHYMSLKK